MTRINLLLCICFIIGNVLNVKSETSKQPEKVFEQKAGASVMKISSNGGRIVSYQFAEKEILTLASEHENFGSTLWTAPQSDWGWPPFAVLDENEYQVEELGSTLKMTSMPDQKSGFQMTKTWKTDGKQTISIEYWIKNISDIPKSVGAWEVTRVPCGGLAFFPDGGEGAVPESDLKIDLRKEGINWVSIDKKPIEDHQKLFSTAKDGWLAYALNGLLFIKQFPDTKPENYSPQQGEVEIYVNKEKSYIELENHGAYQLLQPGQELTYQGKWVLIQIPENIKIEAGSAELCDLIRKKMNDE
jgi:hypothetical protein